MKVLPTYIFSLVLVVATLPAHAGGGSEISLYDFESGAAGWSPVLQKGEAQKGESEDRTNLDPELKARIRELRFLRSQVDLGPPRRAKLAGGIILGVGVVVAAAAGVSCAAANSGSGTECREGRATGLIAGGAGVAGIGLVTLLAGMSSFNERAEKSRNYDQEINSLIRQREQEISNFDARLSLGSENKLTLSWQF